MKLGKSGFEKAGSKVLSTSITMSACIDGLLSFISIIRRKGIELVVSFNTYDLSIKKTFTSN